MNAPSPARASGKHPAVQTALRTLRRAESALGRVGAAWFLCNLAEWAYITALLIDQYRRHGALAVGLIGARFVPGALLGPVVLTVLQHRPVPGVLRALALSRFVMVASVAVASGAHASLPLIVALVWIDAVLAAPYRPVQSSLIPALASTPRELSAMAGSVPASKALAQAVGALLGSVFLLIVAPHSVIASADVLFLVAAALITGVRAATPPVVLASQTAESGEPAGVGGIRLGFRMIARYAMPLLVLGGTRSLTRGLWTSLTVVASLRLLHLGSSGVGILLAAAGVGAAIAIPISLRFTGRPTLAGPGALAFALAGVPISLVGLLASPAAAIVLVVIWGIALTLADSISNALIHRVVEARMLAPSIAAIESSKLLLEGLGALAAPALLAILGVRDALIIAGAPLPLLVIVSGHRLLAIDHRAQTRLRPLAAALRTPSFRGLTMLSVESIASRLEQETAPAGTAVVVEGEVGDCFYLIDSGKVEVAIDGYRVAVLGPGGSFGEKALLRAIPRSATVTALEPTALWRLDGPDFIAAATGSEGPVARRTMHAAAGSVEDLIANVPLFGAIDQRELARLGRQITSPTGAAITREGEPGDAFYVLLDGLVQVTIAGRFIRTLQPGDSFGEIALLHPVQRTATVTATVESKLWKLERATFLDVLKDTLPTSLSGASTADTDLAGAGILV